MRRKQVSVFVENTPGRLEAILDALQSKNVSIRALSVSESAEFGIVRMILEDADRGQSALYESGFTTRVDDLLSYHMPDVAGGLLNTVIKPLADAGINIKYF
ncbi:MAG: amino acid-binding protein, partial [Chloroflexota bacterium]|nr:amino acid-binding protein [Chloroflexota bacterium]